MSTEFTVANAAGAPEGKSEIEVTPEMIRAAALAAADFYEGNGVYNLSEDCLRSIIHSALVLLPRP